MKLSDTEKSILKILYAKGFRFLGRDSIGLAAYKKKPYRLCSPLIYDGMSDWLFNTFDTEHSFCMLNPDDFQKVGNKDAYPRKITANGNLICAKPRAKKAVNV